MERCALDCVRNAAGLGDDVDGFCLREQRPQAKPDDFVIVDKHQSYRGRRCRLRCHDVPNCTTIRVPLFNAEITLAVPPSLRARALM